MGDGHGAMDLGGALYGANAVVGGGAASSARVRVGRARRERVPVAATVDTAAGDGCGRERSLQG